MQCADKGYDIKGFAKIERKRFPHLKEEERLVPEMEVGLDRAKQQGMLARLNYLPHLKIKKL